MPEKYVDIMDTNKYVMVHNSSFFKDICKGWFRAFLENLYFSR